MLSQVRECSRHGVDDGAKDFIGVTLVFFVENFFHFAGVGCRVFPACRIHEKVSRCYKNKICRPRGACQSSLHDFHGGSDIFGVLGDTVIEKCVVLLRNGAFSLLIKQSFTFQKALYGVGDGGRHVYFLRFCMDKGR